MFCTNCGHELPGDARFCPECGTPAPDTARTDDTTASMDVGALDDSSPIGAVPDLEAGTGLLHVIRGPNAGSRFLVDRDATSIGRHPDSHIFLDDVTVSRRHAEIDRVGTDLHLRDLGSLNGTYVNGERVEETVLGTGDEVQIGRFKLIFVAGEQG